MNKKTIFVFTLLIIIIFLFYNQNTQQETNNKEYDVIIVPGQGAKDGVPLDKSYGYGIDVQERIHYAYTIFKNQRKKPTIIMSGYRRMFIPKEYKNIESVAMYNFISRNISMLGYNPNTFILMEKKSHQTLENALYSRELVPKGVKNVLVLSTSKSLQRITFVFENVLTDYNATVKSLRQQTFMDKVHDGLPMFITTILLHIPSDNTKIDVATAILFTFDIVDHAPYYVEFLKGSKKECGQLTKFPVQKYSTPRYGSGLNCQVRNGSG